MNREALSLGNEYTVDTAVVGGGVSGLYTAFRLCTGRESSGSLVNQRVTVFEATSRLGGRLSSVRLVPNSPVVELGGMRYLSTQTLVDTLIEKTFSHHPHLHTSQFHTSNQPESFLYYLRGRRFSEAQLDGPDWSTLLDRYHLPPKWHGMSPDAIIQRIISDVLEADGYSLEMFKGDTWGSHRKWNKVKRNVRYNFDGPYKGRFVYELDMWHVVLDQTDHATYAFLQEASGYNSSFLWSATDMFQVFMEQFCSRAQYKTVNEGMDKLPATLAVEAERAGAKIMMETKLESFRRTDDMDDVGDYRYILYLRNTKVGRRWQMLAKSIVLCIPKAALEGLDKSFLGLARDTQEVEEVKRCVKAVESVPTVKVVLAFDRPWWEKSCGVTGKVVTDLPIRQTYYFGTKEEGRCSVVIGAFVDMEVVRFWKRLQEIKDVREEEVEEEGMAKQGYERASGAVVSEVMRQMVETHGEGVEGIQPVKAGVQVWDEEGGGGVGCHFWRAGVRMWETAAKMRKPFAEESVFVAGEAWSDRQGWVEGALCTAEIVLREHFGLSAPDWLGDLEAAHGAPYYLGW